MPTRAPSVAAMARLWVQLHPVVPPMVIGGVIALAIAGAMTPLSASRETATVVSYGMRFSRRGAKTWLVARLPGRTVTASWIGDTPCPSGAKVVLTRTTTLMGSHYLATSASCLP
jgi:hypothetical protein